MIVYMHATIFKPSGSFFFSLRGKKIAGQSKVLMTIYFP